MLKPLIDRVQSVDSANPFRSPSDFHSLPSARAQAVVYTKSVREARHVQGPRTTPNEAKTLLS
jgi:hypothetical protein